MSYDIFLIKIFALYRWSEGFKTRNAKISVTFLSGNRLKIKYFRFDMACEHHCCKLKTTMRAQYAIISFLFIKECISFVAVKAQSVDMTLQRGKHQKPETDGYRLLKSKLVGKGKGTKRTGSISSDDRDPEYNSESATKGKGSKRGKKPYTSKSVPKVTKSLKKSASTPTLSPVPNRKYKDFLWLLQW